MKCLRRVTSESGSLVRRQDCRFKNMQQHRLTTVVTFGATIASSRVLIFFRFERGRL